MTHLMGGKYLPTVKNLLNVKKNLKPHFDTSIGTKYFRNHFLITKSFSHREYGVGLKYFLSHRISE